jgi:hypothetical protein
MATANTARRMQLGVAGAVVLAAVTYGVTRAKANGTASVPTFFSGALQNLDGGTPLVGSHEIGFDLWTDPTSTAAADHVCSMAPVAVTLQGLGIFQLPLSAACVAVFPLQTLVWYQFTVDGNEATRQPIGAVPYARWAQAASNVFKAVPTYTPNDGGTTFISTTYVSALGAVCGTTAPTNGSFSDPTYNTVGLAASKTLCQTACSSPTAHICLGEDLLRFQMILGTTTVSASGWAENALNECQEETTMPCEISADSCQDFPVVASGPAYGNGMASGTIQRCASGGFGGSDQDAQAPPAGSECENVDLPVTGFTYGPGGSSTPTCDTVQPILCCD